jgi:multidrug resistance efflux pump
MDDKNNPTLREMIDLLTKQTDLRYTERFDAQERAVTAALASAKEAVTKAEVATEKRLESLNELRQVVQDILNKTMPRVEAEQSFKSLQEKLDTAVANWDVRHKEVVTQDANLQKRMDVMAGEKTGAKTTVDNSRANIATAVAIITTLVALFEFFMLFKK